MPEERKSPEAIAKETMDRVKEEKAIRIQGNKDANISAEARDAAASSSLETEKTKENQGTSAPENAEEAEKQAKEDERLLTAKEEELSDDEKARKKELEAKKPEIEEKQKKQNKLNERFGELTTEIKTQKEASQQDKEKIATLEKELKEVKVKLEPADEKTATETKKVYIDDLRQKQVDEDTDKPREDRREMPKEELEDWYSEDPVSAQEWISERTFKRAVDAEEYEQNIGKQKLIKEFLDTVDKSKQKAQERYPNLEKADKKGEELKKSGKTDDEVFKLLCDEFPTYKLMTEILKEDPKKYLRAVNGPEMIADELDKRLKADNKETKKKPDEETSAEKEARIKAEGAEEERQRQENLDNGLSSSHEKEKKNQSEFDREQEKIAGMVGISKEALEARKKKRANIPYSS